MNVKQFVEEYQCPGCIEGSNFDCYKQGDWGVECSKHVAGTIIYPIIGTIFLGMPKGFNRKGLSNTHIYILENVEQAAYCKYDMPVWKYLDENNNTLVRGISPRTSRPFIHIFEGDQRDKIDCCEITTDDIESMD